MQETINYNLKKPEANDNVNIEDFNFNFDKIDEKLFAVIQAWEDFKANGGEIGGTDGTKLKINGRAITAIGEALALIGEGTFPLYYARNRTHNVDQLIPGGKGELGSDEARWQEIYLGNYSKNANGYTKLPNGMIMQWGQIDITISNSNNGAITATLPIAFSTSVRSFGAICSGNSFGWGNSDLIIGNAGCSNTTIRWTCSTRNGVNVNGSVQVTWWILGY